MATFKETNIVIMKQIQRPDTSAGLRGVNIECKPGTRVRPTPTLSLGAFGMLRQKPGPFHGVCRSRYRRPDRHLFDRRRPPQLEATGGSHSAEEPVWVTVGACAIMALLLVTAVAAL